VRFLLGLALICCTRHDPTVDAAQPSSGTVGQVGADASRVLDAPTDAAPPVDAALDAQDAAFDAILAMASLQGKTILHAGDSTVGGDAGLTLALRKRFTELGVKRFASDTWVSTSLLTFAGQPRFAKVLARSQPDVVILTLGTNDVHVPAPDSLLPHVRSILKKIGNRECYWIGPLFIKKKDTGLVAMLRENVKPCVFFDSSELDVPRTHDRIHPTVAGGEVWAEAFWKVMAQARRNNTSLQ
jgi:lysophospholipase L1-like esterase